MNRTILYYPSINIPDTNWLKYALLYWDEVSSIVPEPLIISREFSPDINYLIQEEQFRPIHPEELTFHPGGWDALRNFENEFKEVVLSDGFQKLLNVGPYPQYRWRRNPIYNEEQTNFRIHRNKTTRDILDFLSERGLASNEFDYEYHEWLKFEEKTAMLYMSILAKYLAAINPENTTIGTNMKSYEKFNFHRPGIEDVSPAISLKLQQLIPTPKQSVSLQEIISFKRRRQDNLIHFRRLITDFQLQISNSTSLGELEEAIINFKEELHLGVRDLKATMKDAGLLHNSKTFTALLPLIGSAAVDSTGFITQISELNIPLTGLGGAYSAIKLVPHFIERRNQRREEMRNSPFSYLIQAERSGIIPRLNHN